MGLFVLNHNPEDVEHSVKIAIANLELFLREGQSEDGRWLDYLLCFAQGDIEKALKAIDKEKNDDSETPQ